MRAIGSATGVVVMVLGSTSAAHAEGEATPTIGGSMVTARVDDTDATQLFGVGLEAAWWYGRIGIAAEGARRWDMVGGSPINATLGGSLRVLAYDRMVSSLFEPRDVELGIELHGVVERAWWDGADEPRTAYGFGACLRLRGGSDAEFSNLIAESRLFVRVMTSRYDPTQIAARDVGAGPTMGGRETTIIFGLGAAWGGGQRRYMDRFRLHPLDTLVSDATPAYVEPDAGRP